MRPDAADALAAAIDVGLVSLLRDPTEYSDQFRDTIRIYGWAFRVGDAAAAALAPTLGLAAPRRSDPFWMRDIAQLAVVAATDPPGGPAREAWTLPPLGDVDPTELRSKLDAVGASHFGLAERAAALQEIEALGLAALPALREGLAANAFGYARDVEEATGRMAFIVRAVRLPSDAPPALAEKLNALVGAPLTSAALRDVVSATLQSAGDAFPGASLDVYRGPDNEGVVITLTRLPGSTGGWAAGVSAAVGEKYVGGAGGGWSLRAPREDPSLAAVCDDALAAAPGVRSWVHARVIRKPVD